MKSNFANLISLLSLMLLVIQLAVAPAVAERLPGSIDSTQNTALSASEEPTGEMKISQVGDSGPDLIFRPKTEPSLEGSSLGKGADPFGGMITPVGDFGPYPGSAEIGTFSRPARDPDRENPAAMKALWDEWHKRVAEAIYFRFKASAQLLFKRSAPLSCQVSYMVSRDGRIGNVRVLQPSAIPIFDTMLVNVINSVAGNPVLAFPPNSRRQFVEKTGTFTWNYTGGHGSQNIGDFGPDPEEFHGPFPGHASPTP